MKPRLVFLGTSGNISHHVLSNLFKHYDIHGVVESEIKQNSLFMTAVRSVFNIFNHKSILNFSYDNKLPYLKIGKEDSIDLQVFLDKVKPDIVCICSFSFLLDAKILEKNNCVFINAHPSFLPDYRGPNPLFWHYYNMEEYTGVTVHLVDSSEDGGNIINQNKIKLNIGESSDLNEKDIAKESFFLLSKAIRDIQNNELVSVPQLATSSKKRARRVKFSEKFIDWNSWSSKRVFNFLSGTGRSSDLIVNSFFQRYFFSFIPTSYKMCEINKEINLGKIYKYKKSYLLFCKDGLVTLIRKSFFQRFFTKFNAERFTSEK